MTVTAIPARRGTPLNGGYGPAQAAKELLTRELSAELAPQGIRVFGLRSHGMPETSSLREVFDAKRRDGEHRTFMASDGASGITGATST